MKQTIEYLNRTSRRVIGYLGKLIAKLKHDGKLTISLTLSVPPFVRISFGYSASFSKQADNDNEKRPAAGSLSAA
ncbi:putative trans-acting factor B [Roseibium sp. TrichSKD4]|uniref:hypothetical protein n=1 Tax=Roseibium sp. TrichSKD4 TaxID=744980 RepID=UPI0001E57218|nr:hypothetical protein [Roseibium sp. TrichSKD4]EFO28774.1 putative trans-acting factor B [Roseibium sp. TrichSKD4]